MMFLFALCAQDFALDFAEPVLWDCAVERIEGTLRVRSGRKEEWPGVTLKASKGTWDLSKHERVLMDVVNTGTNAVDVGLRVDNAGADGTMDCNTGHLVLAAGTKGTLVVEIDRRLPVPDGVKLFGMRGFPGSRYQTIDPAQVIQLIVFLSRPSAEHRFEVSRIRASGDHKPEKRTLPADAKSFYPFIDELGQYVHATWPGKTKSEAELRRNALAEVADLARHPGPKGWDRYGGWADGPLLKATGFFRTERHAGRWWLVDPEGRLFFSQGIDCLDFGRGTPVEERQEWFRGLPARDDPSFREFYAPAHEVLHGHYAGRKPLGYTFAAANLLRKHGKEWRGKSTALMHDRLRSWGINTLGNWSEEPIRFARRTPYTVGIHFWGKPLEASEGYWQPFRDVFAPEFAAGLKDRLKWEAGRSAGDPWCLGYFVDNELSWGDETSLAVATLKSPGSQPAKGEFLADLKKKYGEVAKLNAAWGSGHASWEALLAHRQPPDPARAREDLLAFSARTIEQYFRLSRAGVKELAPNQLYLGCRFAWINPLAASIAAKHCDVVSFNVYLRAPETFEFAAKEVPVMIGEFHFGALDRGPFHPGLVRVRDQEERAKCYRDFVRACRRHPQVVGCHWFEYRDQPTTGRELDGENYQIGFVDIADTPYPEMVSAARELGAEIYR